VVGSSDRTGSDISRFTAKDKGRLHDLQPACFCPDPVHQLIRTTKDRVNVGKTMRESSAIVECQVSVFPLSKRPSAKSSRMNDLGASLATQAPGSDNGGAKDLRENNLDEIVGWALARPRLIPTG